MKTKETTCRVCGGLGKPSKGLMNFHNIQTPNKTKEFEIKLLDCIKCEDCGHSWIPAKEIKETLTTRELALKWWKTLYTYGTDVNTQQSLSEKYFKDFKNKIYPQLKDNEIEEIYLKEIQHHTVDSLGSSFISSIESQNTIKPNQKQYTKFNSDLFKAYISKFSDEDKKEALYQIFESLPLMFKEIVEGFVIHSNKHQK